MSDSGYSGQQIDSQNAAPQVLDQTIQGLPSGLGSQPGYMFHIANLLGTAAGNVWQNISSGNKNAPYWMRNPGVPEDADQAMQQAQRMEMSGKQVNLGDIVKGAGDIGGDIIKAGGDLLSSIGALFG